MPVKRRTRLTQFLIKQEAAEGTAETLAAANVLAHAEEISFNYSAELQESVPQNGFMGSGPSVKGKETAACTLRHPATAGVDASTAPPIDLLMLAAGHAQMVVNTIALTGAPSGGTPIPGERFTTTGKVGVFLRVSGSTMTYAHYSGSAFTNDEALTFARSGASATVAASANVTQVGTGYRPTSTSQPSFTFGAIEEGIRKRGFGGRADGSLMTEGAGQILKVDISLSGASDQPVDQALLTGVTKPTIQRLALKAATLTAGANSLCADSFRLNFGIELGEVPCATKASGVESYIIGDRQSSIEVDPHATTEASIPFFDQLIDTTSLAFLAVFGNSTLGECIIAAPVTSYDELGDGERNGYRTHQARLRIQPQDGDDDYVVAFIAAA